MAGRLRSRSRWGILQRLLAAAATGIVALSAFVACVGDDPSVAPSTPANDAATPPGSGDGDAAPADDAGSDVPIDAGHDASDGSNRFCATQTPGAGVVDFFCADFDGEDVTEGFTSVNVPDGGALVQFGDLAYSAPSSLVTQGDATVSWAKVGPLNFKELEVVAHVNVGATVAAPPPRAGSTRIIELYSGPTSVGLAYSRGATVDGMSNYVGYFLVAISCPSACSSTMKRVPALPVNTWTLVGLRWTNTGSVRLTIDGTPAFEGSLFGATDSKVTVTTGLRGVGDAPATPRYAFDNLTISVKR